MFQVEKYQKACRKLISEGIVLLKNLNGVLPLKSSDKIALFSRGQFEYVKSGSGSGGRVNCPYITQFYDEFSSRAQLDEEVSAFYRDFIAENPAEGDGWTYPASQKQPLLPEELVKRAAERNDKAVFILSRICGEGYDCKAEKGNWYLSDEERQSIALICRYFAGRAAVLVNSGNLIDLSWHEELSVPALALVWQGGQEGARGTADALFNVIPPSGRLADTAARLESYPQEVAARITGKPAFGNEVRNFRAEDIYVGYRYFETFAKDDVLFPFGYGLTYTQFAIVCETAAVCGDAVHFVFRVKNTGKERGKEVVQLYFSAPQGRLGKPARVLCGFKKTKELQPGNTQKIEISVPFYTLASYDDTGAAGAESGENTAYCYVAEAGEYAFYAGENVRDAEKCFSFRMDKLRIISRCSQCLAPVFPFEKMATTDGKTYFFEPAALQKSPVRIERSTAAEAPVTGNRGIKLKDVESGRATLEEFVAQFTAEELCMLVRGEGMSSVKGSVSGSASCFGGVSAVWAEAGVPVITTCDGPSGVRLECSIETQQIPSGTLIACAWDPYAAGAVYEGFAGELALHGVDVALAPGMNIHRHPLGGRNFEYYSEDPLLSGENAAAMAEVMAKNGAFVTLKHFAGNEQELCRGSVDEEMSERALREIYLKGFEIAVRGGYAKYIMTSYNRVANVHCSNSYALTTQILRGEWGFRGAVMTDWWAACDSAETLDKGVGCADENADVTKLASGVRAQNDLYMVVPDAATYKDDMKKQLEQGNLTLFDLRRSAENILRCVMLTETFKKGGFKRRDLSVKAGKTLYDKPFSSDKFTVRLPAAKEYAMRFSYAVDGDPLAQYKLTVRVNMQVTVNPVVRGTNGKEETSDLFSVYLPQEAEFWFEGTSWRTEKAAYKITRVMIYEKQD